MTAFSPKEHLRAMTERAHRLLVNDLTALTEDQRTVSPGGCAHSALHIIAECAAVNGFVARYLTTGSRERLKPEEREAHHASFDTTEKALSYLEQETQALLTAFDGLDEASLGEPGDLLSRPMTRFAVAELPAFHIMYHDGQITYIQTLHGDDESHW